MPRFAGDTEGCWVPPRGGLGTPVEHMRWPHEDISAAMSLLLGLDPESCFWKLKGWFQREVSCEILRCGGMTQSACAPTPAEAICRAFIAAKGS